MPEGNKTALGRFLEKTGDWLWALFLLALPFTSLPLVARIIGGQMVAVPSGLIALALAAVWLLPKLLGGMTIPNPLSLRAYRAGCHPPGFFLPNPRLQGHHTLEGKPGVRYHACDGRGFLPRHHAVAAGERIRK
jgi:hypothetical protein